MNLKELEDYIHSITQEDALRPYYPAWINDAILQVASELELPALKLITPATVAITDVTTWLWAMPTNFHKKLFRCEFVDTDGLLKKITVRERIEDLEYRDHTIVRDPITSVATVLQEGATGGQEVFLGIYPLPLTVPVTLNLYYYQLPRKLTAPGDVCGCIPPEFHEAVIPPLVLVRNYQRILDQVIDTDMKGLSYWETKVNEGLNGREMGTIGLKAYIAKLRGKPRRTGGRDPLGYSAWRYYG